MGAPEREVQGALEAAVAAAAANTEGIQKVTGCEVEVKSPESLVREGERAVTVRLKMVVEYGANIPEVGKRVAGGVRQTIFRISGWGLSEIVLEVEDVYLPDHTAEEGPEKG
ncbi:Asp23/Gls24 family envelope stress response protein [Kroppenstedtia eburnea]|uniref:Asp23 family, cell envelope-related function n=1 Tax=Kroppenstedtia eburnea TaxID=714067 RepID=A0A1N7P250_9BACL|nr:Asp23 family, cell envelope-related function [Kroppenstedtia eburnea]